MPPKINLIGKRFSRLVVIQEAEKRNNRICWRCRCDCGNEKDIRGWALRGGGTKSCGCLNIEKAIKQGKSRAKPLGEASKRILYNNYYQAAKMKSMDFALSLDDFGSLTKQNCFYCGIPPQQIVSGHRLNGSYKYNGIDRIDSSKGYILGNVVSCCKYCNFAKHEMTQKEFFEWIIKVYEYNHLERGGLQDRIDEQKEHA